MIIYGKNAVLEALKNKKTISKILVTKNNLELINKFNYVNKNIIKIVSLNDLNKEVEGVHQGIVAYVDEYEYVDLHDFIKKNQDKKDVAVAMLDGLEDPHNLGAILRSADASGVDGVIIPKNRSVSLNSTVAKVSTGAIEHVDVCQVTNLVSTIKELKECGYWVIGLEMDGSVDYKKQDYSGKIVLVVGSEGKGISRLVRENCDFLVHIPMVGHVTSLNASVSASILFYEVLRNRGI